MHKVLTPSWSRTLDAIPAEPSVAIGAAGPGLRSLSHPQQQGASSSPQRPARRLALAGTGMAALIAVGHGINDIYTSVLPALLPTLQARFGLTETVLALLVATFAFSTSFPQPFLGALSDRLSPRLVAASGIVLSAVLLSLVGIVPTVYLLFALLFVGGLGSAALHPAGSILARRAMTGNAGLAVAIFSAGGMIGYAVGPILILYIVERFGMGATPWLMVPGLLLGLLTYALLPHAEIAQQRATIGRDEVQLLAGPVGLLTAAGTLAQIPFLTFLSALPLWLVQTHGVKPDAALIGLTLAVFSLSSAAGGILAGFLSVRIRREILVSGSMLLSLGPLFWVFYAVPGSAAYLLAVALAGVLSYAALPLLVASAQDLAPRAVAAASGMLMGITAGVAGLLYVGIGWLQETIGVGPAIGLSYFALIPAALLAYAVLQRHRTLRSDLSMREGLEFACACLPCGCSSGAAPDSSST